MLEAYSAQREAIAHPYTWTMHPAAALVPIKDFRLAKRRLASFLSSDERQALARSLADAVLSALTPINTYVACDDPEVARFAEERNAAVILTPSRGLSSAVTHAVTRLSEHGIKQVGVVNADIIDGTGVQRLIVDTEGIALVPDRAGHGTNVIVVPTACSFRFSYGPGSFTRHRNSAAQTGLPIHIETYRSWCTDIDTPPDVPSRWWLADAQRFAT